MEKGFQIGDFKVYMDDRTKLFGIADSDGNVIVNAEYEKPTDMGTIYDVLVKGDCKDWTIEDKEEFLEDYGIDTLQVCENCGKFMHEGWTLGGEHACCDECAIALYKDKDGNVLPNAEELFRNDVADADTDDNTDCYWTAWEG